MAWEYESGLFNKDLTPPAFLAPLYTVTYGADSMHATRPQKAEWQLVIGFAWSPGKGGKTVIRGGGLYWETSYYFEKWRGQSVCGPLGNIRITLDASALTHIYPGAAASGRRSSAGGPGYRHDARPDAEHLQPADWGSAEKFAPAVVQKSGPIAVTGLDVAKQAIELFPPNYTLGRSWQSALGVQRE